LVKQRIGSWEGQAVESVESGGQHTAVRAVGC
jgi:hypothetical protein